MSSPSTQRGLIFIDQGRYTEAAKYFRESLAEEPNDAQTLYYLSVCELHVGKAKEALATLDSSLALAPDAEASHALRAVILVDLERYAEAKGSAEEALRLDPYSDFGFVALAATHLARKEWAEAEKAAREALEINPENSDAANQLAHALRLQNRLQESADRSAYMLEQNPEDADTHATAGWTALQRGQVKQAEQHFLEALRLRANHESAREGLKEAFRARSPVYRAYLQYCFFMQRFTTGKQWLIVVGILAGQEIIRKIFPPSIALFVLIIYFLFVLWVHVARAVGNFQLTFDRFARHALSLSETLEAWVVGGSVLAGLPLLIAGALIPQPLALVAGATLIGASFPLAYVFTNRSISGRVLFACAAAFVLLAGGINFAVEVAQLNHSSPELDKLAKAAAGLGSLAALVVMAVTWLANLPALNRRRI